MEVPIRESTGDPCRCRGVAIRMEEVAVLPPATVREVPCGLFVTEVHVYHLGSGAGLVCNDCGVATAGRIVFQVPSARLSWITGHVTGSVSSLSAKCGRVKFRMASGEGVSCRSVQEADTWQPCRFATL